MPTDVSCVMLPSMTSREGKNLNIASLFPRKSHFPTEYHSVIPFVIISSKITNSYTRENFFHLILFEIIFALNEEIVLFFFFKLL
jgi:hypothetical protein